MPCAKAIPKEDSDSEGFQNGDNDDIGGKIEYVFSLSHLAYHTNTCKSWQDALFTWALISAITDVVIVRGLSKGRWGVHQEKMTCLPLLWRPI